MANRDAKETQGKENHNLAAALKKPLPKEKILEL